MSNVWLGFTSLLVVWASAAKCADFDEAAFKHVLADPNLQAAVIGTAKKTNVVIDDACPNAYSKTLETVHVESAPRFDAEGHLVSGSWVQDLFYVGCGAARTLDVFVEFAEGRKPNVSALFPGQYARGSTATKGCFQFGALSILYERRSASRVSKSICGRHRRS